MVLDCQKEALEDLRPNLYWGRLLWELLVLSAMVAEGCWSQDLLVIYK